ncbi:MAG: LPS translocon maturation chaperone LptM [Hyphococcus sp.]
MRVLIMIVALSVALAACGKKAPLRPPEDNPDRVSIR